MVNVQGFTGANNPVLVLGNLDFQDLKSSLENYMKQSDIFTDYDFEGSALATLIDVLTYNSTLYSFYANMIANESFLDTAVKRESVNSLIKPLSYMPTSRRASKAEVVMNGSGQTIRFGDLFRGGGQQWTPDRDYYINGNTVVNLIQGTKIDRISQQLVDNSIAHQRFKIPNPEIDTTTLNVYVNEGNGFNKWSNSGDVVGNISGFTSGSKIYHVRGSYDVGYEIYFGDGILGKKPEHQSEVRYEYLVTSGSNGNEVASFSSTISGVSVTTVQKAGFGGSFEEDIQSIKDNASLAFQAQGRAITSGDYVTLLNQRLGSGIASSVWGGEENEPPNYGRVYVCSLDSNSRQILSDSEKESIISFCKEKAVVSIIPEFIDPVFSDVKVEGAVTVDFNRTYRTAEQIEDLIKEYTATYPIEIFNATFKFSDYVSGLIDLDEGIVGENVELRLSNLIEASEQNKVMSLTIPYFNSFRDPQGTPSSTLESENSFIVEENGEGVLAFMFDDGLGIIKLYDTGSGLLLRDIGSVNYRTGLVQIDNLNALSNFRIQVDPEYNTIRSKNNLIIRMIEPEIQIISAE